MAARTIAASLVSFGDSASRMRLRSALHRPTESAIAHFRVVLNVAVSSAEEETVLARWMARFMRDHWTSISELTGTSSPMEHDKMQKSMTPTCTLSPS